MARQPAFELGLLWSPKALLAFIASSISCGAFDVLGTSALFLPVAAAVLLCFPAGRGRWHRAIIGWFGLALAFEGVGSLTGVPVDGGWLGAGVIGVLGHIVGSGGRAATAGLLLAALLAGWAFDLGDLMRRQGTRGVSSLGRFSAARVRSLPGILRSLDRFAQVSGEQLRRQIRAGAALLQTWRQDQEARHGSTLADSEPHAVDSPMRATTARGTLIETPK